MNTFCEHHKNSINFAYRCFDRILLNGLIQPFQQPERVIGFFNAYREGKRVTRNCLRDIAEQFQNWVKNRCQKWAAPILDAPEGRRDDFVAPYFKNAKQDQVAVILKAREPARIMIAIGAQDRWHLQLAQRWILQYNFYINDQRWGRMFVRICPYLPFSARVCLNQHHCHQIQRNFEFLFSVFYFRTLPSNMSWRGPPPQRSNPRPRPRLYYAFNLLQFPFLCNALQMNFQ